MCTKGAGKNRQSMFGNEPREERRADKQVADATLTPTSRKRGQSGLPMAVEKADVIRTDRCGESHCEDED